MPNIQIRDRWADAINNGCVESCRQLIEQGIDLCETNDDRSNPPLVYAADRGQYAICELLLGEGVDVDTVNDHGSTALHHAVTARGGELVALLLSRGASVDKRNHAGAAPMHWAAVNGNAEACRVLAAAGADVDAFALTGLSNGANFTPLRLAVDAQSIEVCEVLLEFGADPSIRADHELSKRYLTPFLAAIEQGYDEIAQLLYDSGRVDPFYSTREGVEVADIARSPSSVQLVRALQTECAIGRVMEGEGREDAQRPRTMQML